MPDKIFAALLAEWNQIEEADINSDTDFWAVYNNLLVHAADWEEGKI